MVNICILYWDTKCEVRKQNSIVSWNELKKTTSHLKSKNLDINCYLFEFGSNFIFEDSIKIKDSLEYYEKSKKNNLAIFNKVNDNCDFISIMDSDLFFSPNQYDLLERDIIELESKKSKVFYTYNLLDINESERKEIINVDSINYQNLEINHTKFTWRHSWGAGVLGGFFIVPLQEIRNMGGFNENFLTWGAEDDEAHTRMKNYASWVPKINEGPYHLWHPKNTHDKKYFIPVYSDEYFQINKVDRPK